MERTAAPDEEPLRRQLEAFVACVRSRSQPVVSGADGLRALRLAHVDPRSHLRAGVRLPPFFVRPRLCETIDLSRDCLRISTDGPSGASSHGRLNCSFLMVGSPVVWTQTLRVTGFFVSALVHVTLIMILGRSKFGTARLARRRPSRPPPPGTGRVPPPPAEVLRQLRPTPAAPPRVTRAPSAGTDARPGGHETGSASGRLPPSGQRARWFFAGRTDPHRDPRGPPPGTVGAGRCRPRVRRTPPPTAARFRRAWWRMGSTRPGALPAPSGAGDGLSPRARSPRWVRRCRRWRGPCGTSTAGSARPARAALVTGTGQQMGPLFFDPEGADFTVWINHFKNEVYRNWLVPQAVLPRHPRARRPRVHRRP